MNKAKDKTTTANEKDKELYEHQKFDDERLGKLLGLTANNKRKKIKIK